MYYHGVFAFFALQTTPLGGALFIIYKTDYKEYRGPDPTDKVCAADQWQNCIDWNTIKPKRWKQTKNVVIFFLCVFAGNELYYSRKNGLDSAFPSQRVNEE